MDLMGLNPAFDDAVCLIGGLGSDEHPPTGFENPELPPFVSIKLVMFTIFLFAAFTAEHPQPVYGRRNISASHTAFSSTRVMGTCAVEGQAIGLAAALCLKGTHCRAGLYENKARLKETSADFVTR